MRLVDLLEPRDGDETTPAVFVEDRAVTRAALRRGAEALAAELRAAGVRPGHPVAVMLPGGPEVVAAMFGVWTAEAVYVPLNPRTSDAEIAYLVEAVRPAAVVTLPEWADRHTGGALPVVVATNAPDSAELSWAPTEPGRVTPPDVPAHDLDTALVQFTSGTTGRPKPVLLRHSGYLALLEPVLAKLVGDKAKDALAARRAPMPNLIPTSMALSAGIYNVLFAFRVGAPAVIMPAFTTAAFAAAVGRHQIRSTVLPPPAMNMLTDDPSITSLAPLRIVRGITAPLSPLRARMFKDKFGVTVLNCYGQTEIGGEIVGWNAADAREFGDTKLGSIGRPHAGVTPRIVGPDGSDVEAGGQGELYVRTPAVSAGYADGSALGDRLTPDGWFRTGDIARIDAEGFLWIEGRVSDMINRGGLKVFPGEVEEVIRLSPEIADAAVVAVPDDRLGEVPWAFVVLHPGAAFDPAALTTAARERLLPYKIPARFIQLDELPRTEVGKVRATDLIQIAKEHV
ncbi:class I adenylate-forming enzyme family protein [Pseudofrankia inefficax]|uniref:AMP-dependent synthetase and ligase n=1 Tax=Pseudofrankia inefficax (strain DSM 45817 / CECT 9037 / DDB 130130 / EuI1c) TaxID=298654 RepID=E3J876_PSEI1|nr:class I adenylate-forming enzyme family protein [Pseudofrankia inefficax]ADP83269.1 AMP-dependent synthetase and ligase [Pseudofrankia inefficax]